MTPSSIFTMTSFLGRRENLASLTFKQVINKAWDFEAGLETKLFIMKNHIEKAAHKVTRQWTNARVLKIRGVFQRNSPLAFSVLQRACTTCQLLWLSCPQWHMFDYKIYFSQIILPNADRSRIVLGDTKQSNFKDLFQSIKQKRLIQRKRKETNVSDVAEKWPDSNRVSFNISF